MPTKSKREKKKYGFMYRGNGYGFWSRKTAIHKGIQKALSDTSEHAYRGFGLFESEDGKKVDWCCGMYYF